MPPEGPIRFEIGGQTYIMTRATAREFLHALRLTGLVARLYRALGGGKE